jgi:hypothetical protein
MISTSSMQMDAVGTASNHFNGGVGRSSPDYVEWLEWASTARQRYRTDLLDPYVDPITEQHMTIYHHKKSAAAATAAAAGSTAQTLKNDKRCRSPRRVTMNKTTTAIPNATTAVSMSLVGHGKNNISKRTKRSAKLQDWCFASYPNAADVENALKGCGVSRVLAPWESQKEEGEKVESHMEVAEHQSQMKGRVYESLPDASKELGDVLSEARWPNVEEVERAFAEGCRVTSTVWKTGKSKPQRLTDIPLEQPSSAPQLEAPITHQAPSATADRETTSPGPSSVSSLSSHESPQPLLRVTTSAILGKQDEIWKQIQLERQEHIQPAATATPTQRDKHSSGSLKNEVTRRHAQATPPSPTTKFSSTHHSLRGRSAGPTTTAPTRAADHAVPNDSARSYRYQAAANTSSFTEPWSSSYTPPEFVTDRQDFGAKRAAVATVPCLGCQAPLKLSAVRPAATTVVYCPACGTMASAELMRSLIPTSTTVKTAAGRYQDHQDPA